MVPSSVAKIKTLGADLLFPEITKSEVLLKTCPVGVASASAVLPGETGIFTAELLKIGRGCPALLYRVVTPLPLSETQNGPVELKDIPQGFTKFLSLN